MGTPIWIIWYAIALHWTWAFLLMGSNDPLNVTAIHSLRILTPGRYAMGSLLLLVGLLAYLGLRRIDKGVSAIYFLLPQQFILTISAIGAFIAIKNGVFADGVVRSTSFLAADQAPAIFGAVFHTAALIQLFGKEGAIKIWKQLI